MHTSKIKFVHGIYSIETYQNFLITGDEEGVIKVWDLRQQNCLQTFHDNEDYISDLCYVAEKNVLVSTSADGTLAVFHLKRGKLQARSQYLDDELLSLAVVKNNNYVVCGTQSGALEIFKWGEWACSIDKLKGHPQSVDCVYPIDEDTIVTGSSDGMLRLIAIQPNRFLGPLGDHTSTFPIENIDVSFDKNIMGTVSHDYCVNFLNIRFLYEDDDEKEEKEEKDKDKDDNNGDKEEKMEEDDDQNTNNKTTKKGGFFSGLA